MPTRILSDDEILNYIPYAPDMVQQSEVTKATDLGHATVFVRLESLELSGSICSLKVNEKRFYYRPSENKKENDNGETLSRGYNVSIQEKDNKV